MQPTLRMSHLVVGALAVAAFLVTGLVMYGHQPPLSSMDWDDRLLFRSRHIYLLAAALVNLALGVHYALPDARLRRAAAGAGSLLALASAPTLFFAFFAEPMASRPAGPLSALGLYALFGGVLLYALASISRMPRTSTP
jgi:hypothetical protein